MRSVIENGCTYSEVGGYPPNDIGVIRIDIRFSGKKEEIDMHVSE